MTDPGRPTLYRPDYCEFAHNYCLLGATNEDLGSFFGVTSRTIDNWIAANKVEYLRTAGGSIRIFVDTLWREPDGTKHSSDHTAA